MTLCGRLEMCQYATMGEVGSSVPGQQLSLKILVGAVEGVQKCENHHFWGLEIFGRACMII